ncbi:hypothetical protein [Candidatus Symbiopectobacterium sp. 'North America']|uniref:hypothetical protein n=1 Tax=Candidatus Symbiopectobacterium sp. 'North America' TaxID=2794574 RepID=UPI002453E827|nr:hypothetical protein [Candidatus Symbiopectobacterium sp. 'North America']
MWFLFVKDKPAESVFVNQQEVDIINEKQTTAQVQEKKVYKRIPYLDRFIRVRNTPKVTTTQQVYRSWNVFGCGLGYYCQLGISSLLLAWIPTYLLSEKNLSVVGMGFVSAAPWVGAVLGNLLGGILSDTLLDKRRKPGMLLSAVST